jgi:hypothetical protein
MNVDVEFMDPVVQEVEQINVHYVKFRKYLNYVKHNNTVVKNKLKNRRLLRSSVLNM